MCHFLDHWGKLNKNFQLEWHLWLFKSSLDYTMMIFSFKNRVYFEDSALTEHPGAEIEMMTCGIRTRAFGISNKEEHLSRYNLFSSMVETEPHILL